MFCSKMTEHRQRDDDISVTWRQTVFTSFDSNENESLSKPKPNYLSEETCEIVSMCVCVCSLPLPAPLPRPLPRPRPRPRPLTVLLYGAPSLFTLDTSSRSSLNSWSYFPLCQSANTSTRCCSEDPTKPANSKHSCVISFIRSRPKAPPTD